MLNTYFVHAYWPINCNILKLCCLFFLLLRLMLFTNFTVLPYNCLLFYLTTVFRHININKSYLKTQEVKNSSVFGLDPAFLLRHEKSSSVNIKGEWIYWQQQFLISHYSVQILSFFLKMEVQVDKPFKIQFLGGGGEFCKSLVCSWLLG